MAVCRHCGDEGNSPVPDSICTAVGSSPASIRYSPRLQVADRMRSSTSEAHVNSPYPAIRSSERSRSESVARSSDPGLRRSPQIAFFRGHGPSGPYDLSVSPVMRRRSVAFSIPVSVPPDRIRRATLAYADRVDLGKSGDAEFTDADAHLVRAAQQDDGVAYAAVAILGWAMSVVAGMSRNQQEQSIGQPFRHHIGFIFPVSLLALCFGERDQQQHVSAAPSERFAYRTSPGCCGTSCQSHGGRAGHGVATKGGSAVR